MEPILVMRACLGVRAALQQAHHPEGRTGPRSGHTRAPAQRTEATGREIDPPQRRV
ncbi:MAG TPA: hypothetical protein VLI39_14310 [Sedimentisphaerales bacterium]|nr:hypothetical protein [Sedimentisphaerales bacterium]